MSTRCSAGPGGVFAEFRKFVLVTGIAGLPSLLIQHATPDTLGNTYADFAMALYSRRS